MIESHIEHLLPDYLANQLSDPQLEEVELHLSSCQSCRETLTWLMNVESVWEDGPYQEPSVNFADRVMLQIDQLEAEKQAGTESDCTKAEGIQVEEIRADGILADGILADRANEAASTLDMPKRTAAVPRVPIWKRSDIRNMVAAVAASFVLWQGVSGFVQNADVLDESAHGYASVLKVTLQDYLNAATYWLKK